MEGANFLYYTTFFLYFRTSTKDDLISYNMEFYKLSTFAFVRNC